MTLRPPAKAWPQSDAARGTLFFAQLLRELISTGTYESFRAFSLDSVGRLREATTVVGQVKKDIIPRAALTPILEELAATFPTDTVVSAVCGPQVAVIAERLSSQNTSLRDIESYLKYLQGALRQGYKARIEAEIIRLIPLTNRRSELRNAVNLYCSHILNMGYTRRYITDCIDESFFARTVKRVRSETVRSFFGKLSGRKRAYVVHAAVSTPLARHMSSLGFETINAPTDLPVHVRKVYEQEAGLKYTRFLEYRLDSLDEYAAVKAAGVLIRRLKSIAYMAHQGPDFQVYPKSYVSLVRSSYGKFVEEKKITHDRRRPVQVSGGAALKEVKFYTHRVITEFDTPSRARLLRSIDTAAVSHSYADIENILLSYWSAFEVLLEQPSTGGARIVRYLDEITPVLCLRYVRRMFVSVYDELLISYRLEFTKILSAIAEPGVDQHTTFVRMLLLTEYEDSRKSLFNIIRDNPLAMHRVWQVAERFKTPDDLKKSFAAHEQRLRWQIGRIYRTRNSIIHAGATPPYIESLVLNVIEYFRLFIGNISSRAEREAGQSEIGQVVATARLDHEVYLRALRQFKKGDPWTTDSIETFVRV